MANASAETERSLAHVHETLASRLPTFFHTPNSLPLSYLRVTSMTLRHKSAEYSTSYSPGTGADDRALQTISTLGTSQTATLSVRFATSV